MSTATASFYQSIAIRLKAMNNCDHRMSECGDRGPVYQHWSEMRRMHRTHIELLCRDHAPSGSGFDRGTQCLVSDSNWNKIKFVTSFHHMSEHGYYECWTDHTVIVGADLMNGVRIHVTGRDYKGIKELIHEAFQNLHQIQVSY